MTQNKRLKTLDDAEIEYTVYASFLLLASVVYGFGLSDSIKRHYQIFDEALNEASITDKILGKILTLQKSTTDSPTLESLTQIQKVFIKYTESVYCCEFKWLKKQSTSSSPVQICGQTSKVVNRGYPESNKLLAEYLKLVSLFISAQAESPTGSRIFDTLSDNLNSLSDELTTARNLRLTVAGYTHHLIYWLLLILFAVGTFIFPFFITNIKSWKDKILASGIIGVLTAAVLFLIWELSRPLSGIISIDEKLLWASMLSKNREQFLI